MLELCACCTRRQNMPAFDIKNNKLQYVFETYNKYNKVDYTVDID